MCICLRGYFGYACDGVCPGGASHPCQDHGTCLLDGSCQCDWGFTSCSTTNPGCPVDTRSDPSNCGGCAKACAADPTHGVLSAQCSNATCIRQCDGASGWIMCPDGACHHATKCPIDPLPGCQIFNENQCQGDVIVTDPSFDSHRWQTPVRGTAWHIPSYQDMSDLVAYPRVVYAADRKSAKVSVIATTRNPLLTNTLSYYFNGTAQQSNTRAYDSSFRSPLSLSVVSSAGPRIALDPVDFAWAVTPLAPSAADFRNGQKGGVVEMFGWPHADVAKECATLGRLGYMGVKLFPTNEHVMAYNEPFQGDLNPWYFYYQPVSYRLQGRMGTRDDLRDLISTCRRAGVRVFADAVVNHMSGNGNDGNPFHRNSNGGSCVNWGKKNTSAPDPSPYFTQGFTYAYNDNTGLSPTLEFPAVPYGPTDFHCERTLSSWTDPLDLNAGWLVGLCDLNTERDNVQQRIADYLTDLIGIGFSGFRIDAAKHIQPSDLAGIFSKLKANLGGSLPDDFVSWLEVLLGGEAQLLMCNQQSGYNYGLDFVAKMKSAGLSEAEVNQIKIWASWYPKEPGVDCGQVSQWRRAIQNDDADQQNAGSSSRDMADQGSVLIKDNDIPRHRGFEVKLFTNPNGVSDNDNECPIRCVLSSYYWTAEGGVGVPDGKSDCSTCTNPACRNQCHTVPYAPAYDPNSAGYDHSPYTRVHRDMTIVNAMRKWVHLSPI